MTNNFTKTIDINRSGLPARIFFALKHRHRLRNHIDVKLRVFFVLRVLMRIRKFLASTHTRICLANALFLLINRRL